MATAFIDDFQFWQTIVVSLLCGALIGLERQFRGKPAGIRTSILICTGTSLFVFIGSLNDMGQSAAAMAIAALTVGILLSCEYLEKNTKPCARGLTPEPRNRRAIDV